MRSTAFRRRYLAIAGMVCLASPIGAIAQGQGSWGGATGLVGAIGILLLVGVLMICVVSGFIGYRVGYPKRYRPLFALAGALTPIVAIVLFFANDTRKSDEARAAVIEASKAIFRAAQQRIDATCADLQAQETRAVDLQRSLQRRITPRWPALNVPESAMDWPPPLKMVKNAGYRNAWRSLQFEQPYFERHRVKDTSEQLDYVEHVDVVGLYALASATYWRSLLPRLDEDSRQELSSYTSQDRGAEHLIGYRPRKSLARYALDISDVSTHEDRSHWTARLRVKVVEITSGEELFKIEPILPILIDSYGDRNGVVRLCARKGHDAVAIDQNFDWLGYLAREVSAQ